MADRKTKKGISFDRKCWKINDYRSMYEAAPTTSLIHFLCGRIKETDTVIESGGLKESVVQFSEVLLLGIVEQCVNEIPLGHCIFRLHTFTNRFLKDSKR